ncbi:DUF5723 family protein [Allomuricauda sp. SCSIO 65647]|uniref:DUF5723 family protein n=1 Tax=Allomuricauda sp. SCSIO 65647 TaxID=2908843 RepID=UPI001F27A4CB|nr:DUF5723 family protein [Muricauda sp. SCSIO 65647]UJH66546.1 DUF5723 family protein [Muricauda sp. SCSIO 65647]
MKRWQLLILTSLLGIGVLYAQNKQLLYDFYEIPQSLMVNPGVKTPYKWHAGIPLLSGIGFQAGTSGITVNDLFANDGIDFTTKVRDRAVFGMGPRDEFSGSGQIEVFYGGFRSANRPSDYYSFGMYGEGYSSIFWPKDLAILGFEGNANNLNRRFDLGHLTLQGEAVNVFHFGVNRKMNDKLNLGIRAKLYSSVFEFKSKRNSGYFVTTQGDNNILENTLVAQLELQTSGVKELIDILDEDTNTTGADIQQWLLGRSFFGGNLGIGADFGFTYELGQNTFLTGSVLDVGFIYHTNGLENYTLNGAVSNEGIEIILPEDLFDTTTDIWQELVDEIERLVPFETNQNSFISLRPIKLNASVRHNFGERKGSTAEACYCGYDTTDRADGFDYVNSVGGHLFVINRPKGPQAALTAFYQRRFGDVLALKTTYTVDKYSFTNIGLGLNLQAGPVNFYVLADNLLGYGNIADSHYASFQFGFNIISWNDN